MVFCRGCGKEIHESALSCPHCGATQKVPEKAAPQNLKSQTTAAILAAFLGAIGIHRFYLGPIWVGVLYLLFCWTGIPGFIAFIETLIIVFASQQSWADKHNNGVLTPPIHIIVKIFVLLFPTLLILGILAVIVVPQY